MYLYTIMIKYIIFLPIRKISAINKKHDITDDKSQFWMNDRLQK